jgi:circadian clock protein KaiC
MRIHQLIEELSPRVVVIDAITSFQSMGVSAEVASMIVRLIDFLKNKGITLYMTSLSEDGGSLDRAGVDISSVVDTWVLLRKPERDGGRIRTLSILKSRGMAHSHATHEFTITNQGVALKGGSTARA